MGVRERFRGIPLGRRRGGREIVGGGHRWLPDHLYLDLELTDEHRFVSGFVYVAYRTAARAESAG